MTTPPVPMLHEVLGLVALVVVVTLFTWGVDRLERRTRRSGPPTTAPLGYVSDRVLERARREAGERTPVEYVGATWWLPATDDEVPAWRQLAELDLEAEEGSR